MGVDHLLVLCSCPHAASAQMLSTAILDQRLAACVNQLSGVKSLYRWHDKLEEDDEVLLLIKTRASLYEQLEGLIQSLHPYELPEIIGVPLSVGSRDYLQWIDAATQP